MQTPWGWADPLRCRPPGVGQIPSGADPPGLSRPLPPGLDRPPGLGRSPQMQTPWGWADPLRCRPPPGWANPHRYRPPWGWADPPLELGRHPLGLGRPPSADPPQGWEDIPPRYKRGGTHPTGMHTCFGIFSKDKEIDRKEITQGVAYITFILLNQLMEWKELCFSVITQISLNQYWLS